MACLAALFWGVCLPHGGPLGLCSAAASSVSARDQRGNLAAMPRLFELVRNDS
jgi:hypothetical protein